MQARRLSGNGTMPRRGGAAGWLDLAAAPVFLIMAVLTMATGWGEADVHGTTELDGMAIMYGLMSVFHSAPWLGLRVRQA